MTFIAARAALRLARTGPRQGHAHRALPLWLTWHAALALARLGLGHGPGILGCLRTFECVIGYICDRLYLPQRIYPLENAASITRAVRKYA